MEYVYANRHTEEQKPSSFDYLPAEYLSVEEVQEVSADKTPEIIKDHAPITPTNILLRDKFKPINGTSGMRNKNPFQLVCQIHHTKKT